MLGPRAADGLTKKLVLGLLVERPGHAYELDMRLQRRFRSAGYPRGTAGPALRSLCKDSFAQPRLPSPSSSSRGKRHVTIYDPTEEGFAYFEAWISSLVSAEAPIREELIGKVGVCRPVDLPQLIEVTSRAQADLMRRLNSLNFRVRERRRELNLRVWESRLELAISCADHAWMDGQVGFAQELHRHLAGELSDPDGGASLRLI